MSIPTTSTTGITDLHYTQKLLQWDEVSCCTVERCYADGEKGSLHDSAPVALFARYAQRKLRAVAAGNFASADVFPRPLSRSYPHP